MVTFEPSQALTTLESAMRQVMRSAYSAAYGPDWLEKVTSQEQRDRWSRRRDDETPKRHGVVRRLSVEFDFSELWELIDIAGKHWEPLSTALGKRASTMRLLEVFERLRNTVGHSRSLMPFEQELLSGIAGLIRNQVTMSLSAIDPSGEYYPRIESISDSFGNRIDPRRSGSAGGEIAGSADTGLVLRPGEVVTFECFAVDPQGRDLEWTLEVGPVRLMATAPPGQLAKFRWDVGEGEVGEYVPVMFMMAAQGAQYHRANGFDQRGWLEYRVRPLDHP